MLLALSTLVTLLAGAPPAVELTPITDVGAIEVVVREGEWKGRQQDRHLLGGFTVFRDGSWQPVDVGACGTGITDVVVTPGIWKTATPFPIEAAPLPPGRYRYSVTLTSTATSQPTTVTRAFSIAGADDDDVTALLTALTARFVEGCAVPSDVVALLTGRATSTQLRALFDDERLTLAQRVFVALTVDDAELNAALPALVTARRQDLAIAAAVLLANRGVVHDDVLVAGAERGEKVVGWLSLGRAPLARDLVERLVVVLEHAKDLQTATLLASLLSDPRHAVVDEAQRSRGVAALEAWAAASDDPIERGRLRDDAELWWDARPIPPHGGGLHLLRSPAGATCPSSASFDAAVDAVRGSGRIVDEGVVSR